MDGYNGPPRGGGTLCGYLPGGIEFCERDGLDESKFELEGDYEDCIIKYGDKIIPNEGKPITWRHDQGPFLRSLLDKYQPIESGTRMEIGCHHAEMNLICNAAAAGVPTAGAWLIMTGEPCLLCAKLIHHAGITKIIVVHEGYLGPNGLEYLKVHGVEVQFVSGPSDPRISTLHTEDGD